MNKQIALIHGPNLNLLGTRDPKIYGNDSLQEIEERVSKYALTKGYVVKAYQSNVEGEIVNEIHAAIKQQCVAIIINAGAYTHTSVAIRDALEIFSGPIIEVHLSNIYQREEFRHKSFISPLARGVICGFGALGYEFAIDFFKSSGRGSGQNS